MELYLGNFEVGIPRSRRCLERKVARASYRSWLVLRCLGRVDHLGEVRTHHHLLRCIVVVAVAAAVGSTEFALAVGTTGLGRRVVGSSHIDHLEDPPDLDRSLRNFAAARNFDHPQFR